MLRGAASRDHYRGPTQATNASCSHLHKQGNYSPRSVKTSPVSSETGDIKEILSGARSLRIRGDLLGRAVLWRRQEADGLVDCVHRLVPLTHKRAKGDRIPKANLFRCECG